MSTLVMGRLNRYEGNLMTWVRPSNYKLIDRTIRYVDYILKHKHKKEVGYNNIALQVFKYQNIIKDDNSIVMEIVNHFN